MVLAVLHQDWQSHCFGPVMGMPGGNGDEDAPERTAYLMTRKQKRERGSWGATVTFTGMGPVT